MPERSGRGELAQAREPFGEPEPHLVIEVLVQRVAVGHREVRQVVLGAAQVHVAAFGDADGVRQRVGKLRAEDGGHLVVGLQVELIAVIAEPVLIVHGPPRADAQQDVVRHVVPVLQVVDVVGGDQRQAQVAGDRRQAAVDDFLVVDAVPLHLEEEVVATEDVAEPAGGRQRPGGLVRSERRSNLALQTAAQPDDALAVPCQQVLVDARLPVEPFGVAGRHHLDQVVPALARLRQQHQVVVVLADRPAAIVPAARRDVHLAAENRLHASRPRVVVEGDRREHVPVLGHRHGRHAERLHLIEQLVDAARAVEQRVFRVKVQVNELAH